MSERPPALAFLVVMALLRIAGRSSDAVVVAATAPGALRLWWRGVMGGPSPFVRGFEAAMVAKKAGVAVSDLVYGEVFVGSARRLLRRLGVGAGSVVVDLGCGRGAVVVAAHSLGAAARGRDVYAAHVDVIASAAAAVGIDVDVADARAVDAAVVGDADVVWLSWITWADESRRAVSARISAMKPGAVVVGVGHGVVGDDFDVVDRQKIWCTWGLAEVFICRRR